MPKTAAIRPYRPEDRGALRRICWLTGFMGEEAAWFWGDEESFAGAFAGWYLEREPEHCWVAQVDGRLCGYLLGCADSRRVGLAACAARQILRPWALFKPGVARTLMRAALDLLADRSLGPRRFLDPRWPAHLHINLLPEARGLGLGAVLIETWVVRLRELGSPGLHLSTFAENRPAIAFFERVGFARHGEPTRVPGMRTRDGARMHGQIMVRGLDRSASRQGA